MFLKMGWDLKTQKQNGAYANFIAPLGLWEAERQRSPQHLAHRRCSVSVCLLADWLLFGAETEAPMEVEQWWRPAEKCVGGRWLCRAGQWWNRSHHGLRHTPAQIVQSSRGQLGKSCMLLRQDFPRKGALQLAVEQSRSG